MSTDKHARQESHEKHHAAADHHAAAPVEQSGAAAADAVDTAGASAEAGPDRIAALEAELADLKDKYLRKYADFENFKKRLTREREESSKYSNAMLLLDIVNIIDNFERAIKSAEDARDFESFHEGISLIEKQLLENLQKKWGLERFFAKGQAFDPERHEALMAEQSADVAVAMVAEDLQSGYVLHGRVLRPAKVKVLQPLATADAPSGSGQSQP